MEGNLMVTHKVISFTVYKPDDYRPILQAERRRITKLVMKQLFNVAGRFDGPSTIRMDISAKGNI